MKIGIIILILLSFININSQNLSEKSTQLNIQEKKNSKVVIPEYDMNGKSNEEIMTTARTFSSKTNRLVVVIISNNQELKNKIKSIMTDMYNSGHKQLYIVYSDNTSGEVSYILPFANGYRGNPFEHKGQEINDTGSELYVSLVKMYNLRISHSD